MPASGQVIHGHKMRSGASAEYKTWVRMKSRCYRPKDKDYPRWGGKGIRVCERWVHSFGNFLADMGLRPSSTHSIDRLDPSKDYSPENCRWASQKEQCSENKSGLIEITVCGVTFPTLMAACKHFGIRYTTAHKRLNDGIPPDEAFTLARLKPRRTRESYLRKELRPCAPEQAASE